MTNEKRITTRNLVFCGLFSALIAAGAFIKIPIPGMPLTLQFLFTNLAGLLLGKRYGAIASGVYIAVGLVGIPVFTGGGGLGYIFQPTFGYLIGFAAGAWVAGFTIEKCKNHSFKTMLLASFANLAVVSLIGLVYYFVIANYYAHTPIGVSALITNCFLTTLPGDIVKCILSAILGNRLYPIFAKGEK